jgi:hypothetical protein
VTLQPEQKDGSKTLVGNTKDSEKNSRDAWQQVENESVAVWVRFEKSRLVCLVVSESVLEV